MKLIIAILLLTIGAFTQSQYVNASTCATININETYYDNSGDISNCVYVTYYKTGELFCEVTVVIH